MLKKILSLIVAIVMCVSVLAGCNLVTFDSERDNRKVAVTIASYDIKSSDGEQTYTTKEKKIYKSEFVTIYNYYGYMYQQYYGMSAQEAAERVAEELAIERIVINLAEAYLDFGYIEMGTYDKNIVNQNAYAQIDGAISTAKSEILEERGIDSSDSDDHDHDDNEGSTTYPVKEQDSDVYASLPRDTLVELCFERGILTRPNAGDDAAQDAIDLITVRQLKTKLVAYDRKDIPAWTPSLSKYPGLNTYDESTRSLELEAFARALKSIKESVLALYDVTDEQIAKVEEEYENFEKITNEKGLSYVYGALLDSTTLYLYAAEPYEEQQKMALLEEYITGTVEVTKSDVESIYNRTLSEQKAKFASNYYYENAINNNEQLLYFPDSNHFFVKHILVPFSAEQSSALTAYKASVENAINDDYDEYRERLAAEIMSYEHVDGEDYGSLKSIKDIYAEVASKVNAATTLREKERAFDDLIYKYNTDSGIFSKISYGYMEVYDLNGGTESYVAEFAAAARELYEGGKEGAVSGMVATDYGVHILYLSKLPKAGEVVGLDDYYTNGEYDLVYATMEEKALSEKESAAFSKWRETQISFYYKGSAENASVVSVNDKVVKSVL